MSGVVSQQLSFSLPAREYEDAGELYGAGSVTTLTCSNGADFPVFYVISRSFSGDKLNMVCYDKSYTVDREIPVTKDDFDSDGNIPVTVVMQGICAVCGFASYTDTTNSIGRTVVYANKDNVLGASCRSFLDDISGVCGGCCIVSGDNGGDAPSGILILAAAESYTSSMLTPDKYSDVKLGGTHRFTGIVLTNGDKTYTAGDTATLYNSLNADTPYASAQAAGDLYGRLRDFVYRGWECDKLLCDLYPAPPALVKFGDRQLTANHCTLNLTASGMFASLGGNAVSEDGTEYLNRLSREMKERYRLGSLMNNARLSKSGLELVFEDKNSGKKKTYGFSVNENGVTEYKGAMVDTVMPTSIEDDGSTDTKVKKKVVYDGKTYTLQYTKEGDKKTNISFTEVDKK